MDVLRIGKDLKGSDRGLFKVACQHFLGVTQKNAKILEQDRWCLDRDWNQIIPE